MISGDDPQADIAHRLSLRDEIKFNGKFGMEGERVVIKFNFRDLKRNEVGIEVASLQIRDEARRVFARPGSPASRIRVR